MARWLTACLLSVSSMLLTGCMVAHHAALAGVFTSCDAVYRAPVQTATYTAQIDFYKKHFSGLFVFKALNDTTERAVFVTETGFKFFDFEFGPNHFTVQYIVPNLNKKIIVNTFKKDISYLLVPPIVNSAHTQTKNDTSLTSIFPIKKGFNYYTTDSACTELKQIERGTDKRKNLAIDFTHSQNNNPQTINIAHKNVKLTIFMKQINH